MRNLLMALAVGLVGLGAGSCPTSMACPLHSGMIGTFHHDEFQSGKKVRVFSCPADRGHKFSVVC